MRLRGRGHFGQRDWAVYIVVLTCVLAAAAIAVATL
jgi:hypothetical protein